MAVPEGATHVLKVIKKGKYGPKPKFFYFEDMAGARIERDRFKKDPEVQSVKITKVK